MMAVLVVLLETGDKGESIVSYFKSISNNDNYKSHNFKCLFYIQIRLALDRDRISDIISKEIA